MLEALQTLLLSTGVVTASEIGDKTMLMAICLAARFRRPAPIIWGILVATVLNHAMAGGVGAVLATLITPEILRWILIVSFAAMAAWMLVPDKLDDEETDEGRMKRFGVFGTTVVLFFLAEMGDKTQLATVALAAKFPAEALWVISGTTLGMMIADAPAVFIGNKLAERLSMKLMRRIAAAVLASPLPPGSAADPAALTPPPRRQGPEASKKIKKARGLSDSGRINPTKRSGGLVAFRRRSPMS